MASPRYDMSVGHDQRIFQVQATGAYTLFKDLFPTPIINFIEGKIVMDGYAFSTDNAWRVMDVNAGSSDWYENVAANVKYSFPFLDWQNKVVVMSTGGSGILTVRLVVDR